MLQRRIKISLSRYLSKDFDLLPHSLKSIAIIKDKEEWANELNELMSIKMNKVENKENYNWFVRTTEEVVQVFYKNKFFQTRFVWDKEIGKRYFEERERDIEFQLAK